MRVADLALEKFIDTQTLADAATLPIATSEPHTVLLTGANRRTAPSVLVGEKAADLILSAYDPISLSPDTHSN